MHGTEFTDPAKWGRPLAYYASSGPIGQAFARMGPHPEVAAIGLGTGALSCYRRPGETWTFFEIDAAVERIARDYFHYLAKCGGAKIVLGDGRLSLKAMPDHHFDLLIVDAFSSDAVPTHLLTREAMALYLQKLKPRGVILFNVSNEYLELAPVLTNVVASTGAVARRQLYYPTPQERSRGATASEWMAIAADGADLDFLNPENRWRSIAPEPGARPWTDDFSNIFRAIRW
jgi:spermidine synthase